MFRPTVLADLGYGVLDAMVETAAYVLSVLDEKEEQELTERLILTLRHLHKYKSDLFSIAQYRQARAGLKRHQALAEFRDLAGRRFISEIAGNSIKYWVGEENKFPPNVLKDILYLPLVCIR